MRQYYSDGLGRQLPATPARKNASCTSEPDGMDKVQADAEALDHVLAQLGEILYERRDREGQLRRLQEQRERLTWELFAVPGRHSRRTSSASRSPSSAPPPRPSRAPRPADLPSDRASPRQTGLEQVKAAIREALAGLDRIDEDFEPLMEVFWRSLYARARLDKSRRRNGRQIYREAIGRAGTPPGCSSGNARWI